jgi:hypothetical protein
MRIGASGHDIKGFSGYFVALLHISCNIMLDTSKTAEEDNTLEHGIL